MGFSNYPTKRKGVKDMQKQTIQFATVTKNGVVQKVGKSTILQPTINYDGRSTKWFDDSKLIRKEDISNER